MFTKVVLDFRFGQEIAHRVIRGGLLTIKRRRRRRRRGRRVEEYVDEAEEERGGRGRGVMATA